MSSLEEIPWILRKYFSSSMQEVLEKLEINTGLQFDDVGWETTLDRNLTTMVNGTDIDGERILFGRTDSGRSYIWLRDRQYSLSEALPRLKSRFEDKMKWFKHRGEGLEKIGVDTGGLEVGSKIKLENILQDMGTEIPESWTQLDEKLTGEEGEDLGRKWKDFINDWKRNQ